MFEARASGKRWGRPRFKPRRKYKSFTLLQTGWKLLPGNRIKIEKRVYCYFKSRDMFGNPKRCTIKRDAINFSNAVLMLSNVLTEHIHEPRSSQTIVNGHGLTWHASTARLNGNERISIGNLHTCLLTNTTKYGLKLSICKA